MYFQEVSPVLTALASRERVVGVKQSARAIRDGRAEEIFLACDADTAVNKQQHSDRFVERLKKTHDVTYVEVPGMRHCDLQGDAAEQYYGFITSDRWFG